MPAPPRLLAPLCLLKSLVYGPPPPLPVVKQTYTCDAAPATSHPCSKNPWSCHQLHLPPSHRPTGNSTVSFVIRSAVSLSHLNSAVPPYPTKASSPSSVLTSSLTLPVSSTPDVRMPVTIFYSTLSGLGRPRTHAHALDGYEIFARIYKRPICLPRNEGSLFLEGSRNSLVCCRNCRSPFVLLGHSSYSSFSFELRLRSLDADPSQLPRSPASWLRHLKSCCSHAHPFHKLTRASFDALSYCTPMLLLWSNQGSAPRWAGLSTRSLGAFW